MRLKKVVAGLLFSMAFMVIGGAALASDIHEYHDVVPNYGDNAYSDVHRANGPLQLVKILNAENNADLFATVVDADDYEHLGEEEQRCIIGKWEDVRSNAYEYRRIRMMLETRIYNPSDIYTEYKVWW